jgi:hypothetical protein
VNADGRSAGDVADIMRVIGTERAQLTRRYHKGLLTRTVLLQNARRNDEGSRRFTVVMEASGLPG